MAGRYNQLTKDNNMSAFKNDNTVQYGSRVLTIGSADGGTGGTTYVADNITVTRGAKTIERTNEIDEPSGQVSYATFVTGSATLQLASGSTAVPIQGWEFTATFVASIGAEEFYIDSVTQPESKDAEKKINITFRKVVND